jgi:outer membrane protein TolC
MRWKKFVGGLALSLTVATGCKQPIFMTEGDYVNTLSAAQLPKDLEENSAHSTIKPNVADKLVAKPSNVLDPERPIRFLALTEAFKLALENGTIGQGIGSGLSNDTTTSTVIPTNARALGFGAIDTDSIRVQMLNPANVATDIEAALSKFDAQWVTSMTWNTTDRPVGTPIDQFQAQGATSIRTQAAEFTTTLLKPLPTGGVAGITFDTQYQFTNLPSRVNPSYTPTLTFQFEQPLFQGYGVDINELRTIHPGSILTPGVINAPQNANEGIVLTRLRYDQTRADLELNLQNMLLNVEVAYWNLYSAYGQLYAQEIGVRKNLEIWRLTKERVEAGTKNFTPADLYDAQGKYETSRSGWLAALGAVLEAERNLRGLIGLRLEDGTRLVPSDPPTLAAFRPDWETSLQEALMLKPDLVIEREQLRASQLHLILLKNQLLPDVRFTSSYNINGLGSRLDGDNATAEQGGNALRNLASDHFNSWALGLRANIPIGFRDANAGMRLGRLQLAQAYWSLRTGEEKSTRFLGLQYRHIFEFQEQMQRNLASAEAYNNELLVRIQRVRGGVDTPDVTLLAIQFGTQALTQYYQFLGQYNAALATFEWAKGTLLRRDNVMIADGPLPNCPQIRAIEHEQERDKACILRERAIPPTCGPAGCAPDGILPPIPDAPSLQDWLRTRQPLPPEVDTPPEPLPAPKPLDKTGASAGSTSKLQLQPLTFPDDKKALPTLPPLPPADAGKASH